MNRDELTNIEQLQKQIDALQVKVDGVDKQVDTVERRLEVIQVRQELGQERSQEMKDTLDKQDAKLDVLVDRVADNRLEYWKTGGFAAAITVALNALGWKVNQ